MKHGIFSFVELGKKTITMNKEENKEMNSLIYMSLALIQAYNNMKRRKINKLDIILIYLYIIYFI